MSFFECVAVLFSVMGVILTIRRNLWCWIINFIAYVMYAILFFEFKLYAETLLQLFFMLMTIFGFWRWKQNLVIEKLLTIHSLAWQKMISQIVIAMSLGAIFGWALKQWTDASLPLLDSQLAALSLLATYWTSRRYRVTWILWIIVNICYVGMFYYKVLYLTAFLYFLFIGLAVWGWTQWNTVKISNQKL